MPRTIIGKYLALGAIVVLVAGCFRLARTSPRVETYVLGGAPDAQPAVDRAVVHEGAALRIGLRRLDLAPYLSTLAIVVRYDNNEIIASGFHRWAESPTAGVSRALSGYLAVTPRVRSVDVAPWPSRSTLDYVVQLHVTRFEGVATGESTARVGEAHVQARWEILRPPDDLLVARGSTELRTRDWVLDDYAGLVSRLDQGLVRMSEDIVACLIRLAAPTPGATASATGARLQVPPLECSVR